MIFRRNMWRLPTAMHVKTLFSKPTATVESALSIGLKDLQERLAFLRIHGPTAEEVSKGIDLSGKTCLITGGNSGIGLEITRCLASRGCNMLMACRNTYAASLVAKNTFESSEQIRLYEINLASLQSVKKCSEEILKDQKKIDIFVLNAGTFGLPWTLTEDGLETTFQVNYLSQYFLLMSLEKCLAPDARVVIVSSESHRNVKWTVYDTIAPTEDLLSLPQDKYTSIKAYNISKLCGILFMHYLGYRWLNTAKSVFSAHPGSFVKTRLCRNWWVYELLYTCVTPFTKSIKQAASTPIYCATSPDLNNLSGIYYKNCQRYEESDLAKDSHLSFRIQNLSQEIINARISMPHEPLLDVKKDVRIDEAKNVVEESLISNYSA